MAQFYNITQYSEGNQFNGKYGALQSFFLDIEGYDGATIMTNKKPGNTPRLGQTYGDLIDTNKIGKKGQKIYQFKAQKMPDGMVAPASSTGLATGTGYAAPAVSSDRGQNIPEWFAPYAVMIKSIYASLSEQKTDTPDVPFTEEPRGAKPEDTIDGTNLSKAELEDIFGGSMDIVDIEEE